MSYTPPTVGPSDHDAADTRARGDQQDEASVTGLLDGDETAGGTLNITTRVAPAWGRPRDGQSSGDSSLSQRALYVRDVLESMTDRRVLNLGCGVSPIAGAVNHDRIPHGDHIDIAFDLDVVGGNRHLSWPIPDGRFDKIIALDVFEHLRADIDVWLRECWRILADDGGIILRVSAWDNPVSYRDPTHRRVFHEETFFFFDPRHALHRTYGRIYFPGGPWFRVKLIERGNADPRYGVGDICAVLQKVARP